MLSVNEYQEQLRKDTNDFFSYYHQQIVDDPDNHPAYMLSLEEWDIHFVEYLEARAKDDIFEAYNYKEQT